MTYQKFAVLGCLAVLLSLSCKDTEKEEKELNQKLEQIESVEQAVDSTVTEVEEKASEVQGMIKELDSI